uniref:Uncharacterized protein n=1 Tax=Rhizophora mucronata TaxID=61149 RepID=A0A2P2NJ12_RHIMU
MVTWCFGRDMPYFSCKISVNILDRQGKRKLIGKKMGKIIVAEIDINCATIF